MSQFQEPNVDQPLGTAFRRQMSEAEYAPNVEHKVFHHEVIGQGSFERGVSNQKGALLSNVERDISYQPLNGEREIADQGTEAEQQRELLREQYKRCENAVSALSADTMDELAQREGEIERLQQELAQIMAKTIHNGSEDQRARRERVLQDKNTHLLEELNRAYAMRYEDAISMQKLVQERKDAYRKLREFEEERKRNQAEQEGVQKTLDHLQWQLSEEQERRSESDKRVRQLEQDMEEHKRRMQAMSDGASSAHSRIHDALSAARITESRLREVAKPSSPPVWTRQTISPTQKPLNAEFVAQMDTRTKREVSSLTAQSLSQTHNRPVSSLHGAVAPTRHEPHPFRSHQAITSTPTELSPVTTYSTTPPTHSTHFPINVRSARTSVHNAPLPFSLPPATAPTHNAPSSFTPVDGKPAQLPRTTSTRPTDVLHLNQWSSGAKAVDSLYASTCSKRDNGSKCAAMRTYVDAARGHTHLSSNTSTRGSSPADIQNANLLHVKLADAHDNSVSCSTSTSAQSSDRMSTARGGENGGAHELQFKAKKKHADRMAKRLQEEIDRTTMLLASALEGVPAENDNRGILSIEQSV